LQHGRGRVHDDLFLDRAYLQREINPKPVLNLEHNAIACFRLETLGFHADGIVPDTQRGNDVGTRGVGLDNGSCTRGNIGNRDDGSGDSCAAPVNDGTEDCCRVRLAIEADGKRHEGKHQPDKSV
jgi:hypothetical protein